MHKSDRTAAGCTVEDEPYKVLERDAEKSILAGPLRFPPGQLPFSTSLKAPVPFTHDAVTVPVMFGLRSAVDLNITRGPRKEPGRFMKELAEFLKQEVIPTGTAVMP